MPERSARRARTIDASGTAREPPPEKTPVALTREPPSPYAAPRSSFALFGVCRRSERLSSDRNREAGVGIRRRHRGNCRRRAVFCRRTGERARGRRAGGGGRALLRAAVSRERPRLPRRRQPRGDCRRAPFRRRTSSLRRGAERRPNRGSPASRMIRGGIDRKPCASGFPAPDKGFRDPGARGFRRRPARPRGRRPGAR